MTVKKIAILSFLLGCLMFTSCEKTYTCICTSKATGEKIPGDKVKTTKLGKKGFEKSCKANNDVAGSNLTGCHVE